MQHKNFAVLISGDTAAPNNYANYAETSGAILKRGASPF